MGFSAVGNTIVEVEKGEAGDKKGQEAEATFHTKLNDHFTYIRQKIGRVARNSKALFYFRFRGPHVLELTRSVNTDTARQSKLFRLVEILAIKSVLVC